MPTSIVSIRFFLQELFKLQGTQLSMSTTYIPKWMDKQRFSMSVSKNIRDVYPLQWSTGGHNPYLLLNGGIVPKWLLRNMSMANNHLQ